MIKIAFVEDSIEEVKQFKEYCEEFSKEFNEIISLSDFSNGLNFLSNYHNDFDFVFMDIDMPILNGLQASKSLREIDKDVNIVFYTNLAKYAIKGYEVNALDFLVKPVSYSTFKAKLNKWFSINKTNKQKNNFILNLIGGTTIKITLSDIYYIESIKHNLVYHTKKETYTTRETIRDLEKKISIYGFSRSINGILINLNYVSKIEKDTIYIEKGNGTIALPLARTRKKEFMKDFMLHLKKGA